MSILHCKYCIKPYKNETAHKKHEIFCKCIQDARSDKDLCLTNTEMYSCMRTLLDKYLNLEKEVEVLRSYVQMKKRSVDILDWLTENVKPEIDNRKWFSKFEILEKHLILIFEKDFAQGITEILIEIYNHSTAPIKCFDQKYNQIYIFTTDKWSILNDEDFTKIINKIQQKLLILFVAWQTKNQSKLESEQFQNIYTENSCKVFGSNFKEDTVNNKIKHMFYKNTKISIKQMASLEIIF